MGKFYECAKKLCEQMTAKEKLGQIAQTAAGYRAYERKGEDIEFNDSFKKIVADFGGIGALSGLLRADPWTSRNYETGVTLEMRQAAADKLQNYLKENTRLGIPALIEVEASHGLQSLDSVSYPVNLCSGATFNPKLFEKQCELIGREISLSKNHIAFFTALDLARDPRWGRSEECFGEDTYLSVQMTAAATKGIKKGGALMCAKHFCGAGSCQGGKNIANVSVGENELMNFSVPVAKAAAENGADFFMVAYNTFDGVPMHANTHFLKDVLRKELGFDGVVISDGFGVKTTAETLRLSAAEGAKICLQSGIDLSLGDGGCFTALETELSENEELKALVDNAVIRVLEKKFEAGLFEKKQAHSVADFINSGICQKTAYEAACEGVVMLKNNGILPLDSAKKVLLLGENADDIYFLLGDYTSPRKTGAHKTVKDAFFDTFENCTYEKGWSFGEKIDPEKALEKAENCDVICLCLGGSSVRNFDAKYLENGAVLNSEAFMDCGEGCDVADLKLPENQLQLLRKLKKLGKPIISVVIAGRAYEISRVAEESDAVLMAFYPGEKGGKAIADIVCGKVNPSGKLPVTLPGDSAALPVCYNCVTPTSSYVNCENPVLFPFGFGLSYSDFVIENIKVEGHKITAEIENKSGVEGCEVIQIYIGLEGGPIKMPQKQLKAFKKVRLKSVERKTVEISLNENTYKAWTKATGFAKNHKKAKIYVGNSSLAPLVCEITL